MYSVVPIVKREITPTDEMINYVMNHPGCIPTQLIAYMAGYDANNIPVQPRSEIRLSPKPGYKRLYELTGKNPINENPPLISRPDMKNRWIRHLYINEKNDIINIKKRIQRMINLTEDFKKAVINFKVRRKDNSKNKSVYLNDLIHLLQYHYYADITGIARTIEWKIKSLEDRQALYGDYIELLSKSTDLNTVLHPFTRQALATSVEKLDKLHKKHAKGVSRMDFKALFDLVPRLLSEPTL